MTLAPPQWPTPPSGLEPQPYPTGSIPRRVCLDYSRLRRERQRLQDTRGRYLGSLAGIDLFELWIVTPNGSGPVASARAWVESAGSVTSRQRATLTRIGTGALLLGPLGAVLALGFPKKKQIDNRELYIQVWTPYLSSVVRCPPSRNFEARRFAAKITTAGSQAYAVAAQRAARLQQVEREIQILEGTHPGLPEEVQRRQTVRNLGILAVAFFCTVLLILGLITMGTNGQDQESSFFDEGLTTPVSSSADTSQRSLYIAEHHDHGTPCNEVGLVSANGSECRETIYGLAWITINVGDRCTEQQLGIETQTVRCIDSIYGRGWAPVEPPATESESDDTTLEAYAPAIMPDVYCMNLQDAQDAIQAVGWFWSDSIDLSGHGRLQIWDRSWVVLAQIPLPGEPIYGDPLLGVLRIEEAPECG